MGGFGVPSGAASHSGRAPCSSHCAAPRRSSCSTNIVVLTNGQVTARGCAAYSVIAHVGVGLIVLGAILLLGSFVLAVRQRRNGAEAASTTGVVPGASPGTGSDERSPRVVPPTRQEPGQGTPREPARSTAQLPAESTPARAGSVARRGTHPAPDVDDLADEPSSPAGSSPVGEWPHVERRRTERRAVARVGPIAPGEDAPGPVGPTSLPPGWYGNPDNPGGPIQWWDGTRLVDRPR